MSKAASSEVDAKQAVAHKITMIMTPAQLFVYGSAVAVVWWLHRHYDWGLFALVLMFYLVVVVATFIALKAIRTWFPLREGLYEFRKKPWECAAILAQQFLEITNLHLLEMSGLVPPMFKKFYYRALGAKMGKGIITISGKLLYPSLITMEQDAGIGDDASVDAIAIMGPEKLLLGRVRIKSGAIVGGKALVGPWATVGENSIVSAMSVVPMFTNIPPNEVWSGNPAKKVEA